MRHFFRLCRRSHFIARLVLFAPLFFFGELSQAVPVYLSPDSLFASGSYHRDWLLERTSAKTTQRWLKVRGSQGAAGWVQEDHVASPLLLSTYARTQTITHLRMEMKPESRSLVTLAAGARVRLLGRNGRWMAAQPEGTSVTGFIPTDSLRPDLDAPALALAKEQTRLLISGHVKSENLGTVRAGERVEILKSDKASHWVLARLRGVVGYVLRAHLILRDDIPRGTVLSLTPQLPLRKESAPFAEPVRLASRLETLRIIDSRIEEWGRVVLREDGEIWWPMNQTALEPGDANPKAQKIKTAELFQRQIFDMASSPVRLGVKFASADGIFRTTDGREWTKVEMFRNQNYPIAISPSGRIYIGPYYSDDHGESFKEYIRWDNLVSSIRDRWDSPEHKVRILEVKPSDYRGNKIELSLDIGMKDKIRVASDDQGKTWRTR